MAKKIIELKNIITVQYFFEILNQTTRGHELVTNFNRSVLFELQKQALFNSLINDITINSSMQFIFKFKRKRFEKLAQILIIQMYNYVKNDGIINYTNGDNIQILITSMAKYIRTNPNIIQMAYNLWKEKHKQEKANTDEKQLNSVYNADNINDRLFNKITFNFTNAGQVFLFVNDQFILDETSQAQYPTDNIMNRMLNDYGEDNIKNYAFGMQYPSGTCFVVKDLNMGVSSYQELKKQAEASKIYKVLSKQRNKLMTQRMAKKIV